MTLISHKFIVPPERSLFAAHDPAPGPIDLAPLIRLFESWHGLQHHQRASLIRDTGAAVARSAGVPAGLIAAVSRG